MKRDKPVHKKLPRRTPDNTPGIFAVAGHGPDGPILASVGNTHAVIFRRRDGGEFRVTFTDHTALEVSENGGGCLSVHPVVSNSIVVKVHRWEDQ